MFGTGAETIIMSMNQWTGSEFVTLLMIVICIIILGLAFPLPLEWTAIFIMPLLLLLMVTNAAFYPTGAVFLLYLAFILGKNFIFK